MKIAVVGAGLCGLAAAWHLRRGGCEVTVYDSGVGAEASGVAAGLMHPYPGEEAKRSFMATEGIEATRALLAVAQKKSLVPLACERGILRRPHAEETSKRLMEQAKVHGDIEAREGAFWLKAGVTIFCRRYLESLWLVLEEMGVQWRQQRIGALTDVCGYDHVVLALGAGIKAFEELRFLRLELLKGQVLVCRVPDTLEMPECSMLLGKGYMARTEQERICLLGATYERDFTSGAVDLERAKREILPKVTPYYPNASALEIQECRAAFRVMRIGHYCPILLHLNRNSLKDWNFGKEAPQNFDSERATIADRQGASENQDCEVKPTRPKTDSSGCFGSTPSTWVCTALGSRGLLYHALMGQLLSRALLAGEKIPKEFAP